MARIILLIFTSLAVIEFAKSKTIEELFPSVINNSTLVTWKLIKNNTELIAAANDSKVMMLKANVYIKADGNVPSIENTTDKGDLKLDDFLKKVEEKQKGAKLYFKTNDIFNKSIAIVKAYDTKLVGQVWIHADVFKGPFKPADVLPEVVDPTKLIEKLNGASNFVISLGWTSIEGNIDKTYGDIKYTPEMFDKMLEQINKIKTNNMTNVIISVRAALAVNDIEVIKTFMKKNTDLKLTIWSKDGDFVNEEKLSQLILDIGVNKVYLDIPKTLMDKLKFISVPNAAPSSFSSNIVFTFMSSILSFLFVIRML